MVISFRKKSYYPLLLIITAVNFCLASPNAEKLLKRKEFVWKSVETEHLRIHFESSNTWALNHFEDLKRFQENAFAKNLALLKINKFSPKIDIFSVDSKKRMKQLIGEDSNGVAFPDTKVVCIIYNEQIHYWGSHELMHIMAGDSWGIKFEQWINEGFATYSDEYWNGYKLNDFNKFLLQEKKLIPLEMLINKFNNFSWSISYPQAGSFVKFIYEQYGVDKLKQIWKNGKVKDLERILGKTITALEKEWLNKLSEADASKVKYDFPKDE